MVLTCNHAFNLHNLLRVMILFVFSFFRWSSWGNEDAGKLSKSAQGHAARSHIASVPSHASVSILFICYLRENPRDLTTLLPNSHSPASCLSLVLCLPCTFLSLSLDKCALYASSLGCSTSNSSSHFPTQVPPYPSLAAGLIFSACSLSNCTSSSSTDSMRPLYSSFSEKIDTPASVESWTYRCQGQI